MPSRISWRSKNKISNQSQQMIISEYTGTSEGQKMLHGDTHTILRLLAKVAQHVQ
jgi:hypothetical protein